ncbi:hypothetical protein M422DRAFT_171983, partial [Sphaerobolus stellatus SS14]
ISVITSRNKYRDKINDLSSDRFAQSTGQTLCHFYSIDTLTEAAVKETQWIQGRSRLKCAYYQAHNTIHPVKQHALWKLYPDMTKHKARILSLCVGMPVMIKKNVATELCITNGAEANIVGWSYVSRNYCGKKLSVLEVVFVKLKNPPKNVDLPGLPENIVPIPRSSTRIECVLLNGSIVPINRDQVDILPNFAMTDYASQGRTRPINVLDLTDCESHISYYTCFSRSATVNGTVIIGGFNPSVIQGGISGWLRQEFRELEMPNDITRAKLAGTLHPFIEGQDRVQLVKSNCHVLGKQYMPSGIHSSLSSTNVSDESTPIELDINEIIAKATAESKHTLETERYKK